MYRLYYSFKFSFTPGASSPSATFVIPIEFVTSVGSCKAAIVIPNVI